jgi:hypothetical protein
MLKNGSNVRIARTLLEGVVIGGIYGETLQFLVEYVNDEGETLQKYCEADTLIELGKEA